MSLLLTCIASSKCLHTEHLTAAFIARSQE